MCLELSLIPRPNTTWLFLNIANIKDIFIFAKILDWVIYITQALYPKILIDINVYTLLKYFVYTSKVFVFPKSTRTEKGVLHFTIQSVYLFYLPAK